MEAAVCSTATTEVVPVLSKSNDDDDDNKENDSSENSLLQEMDSYWEDLTARLTVSRMVSDSIIKGMVNAIQQEATDTIALKEQQQQLLNHRRRLHYYQSSDDDHDTRNVSVSNMEEPQQHILDLRLCSADAGPALNFHKQPDRSRIAALLKQLQNLQDELETILSDHQNLIDAITNNWKKRSHAISSLRQDLDAIYSSLSSNSSDMASLISHRNVAGFDERNTEDIPDNVPRKHQASPKESGSISNVFVQKHEEFGKLAPGESPQLMCKTKEGLITYFRTEMNKMKRQHELALQEKTEELFSLKRDFLKEKGSSPLHACKDKDFESMKKKISALILKVDDILSQNNEMPTVFDDQGILCRFKDSITNILMETRSLQGALIDEEKDPRRSITQVSTVTDTIEEIERLQLALEEANIEATIKEEKYKSVLKELLDVIERDRHGLGTVAKIIEDNYCTIYGGVASDILCRVKPIMEKLYKEKDSIDKELSQKKTALSVTMEENERLKQDNTSSSTVLKEQEKLALDLGFKLAKQKEQFDFLYHECNLYQSKVNEQEVVIANIKIDLDLLKSKLDETLKQVCQKEVEICSLNEQLVTKSSSLAEMEKQNDILYKIIQEKQEKLVLAITNNQEQSKKLGSIVVSLSDFSNTMSDFGCELMQKIETYEPRLNLLNQSCNQLKNKSSLLKRKVTWYKERFETRCDDLQKAEIEVDLLGDEVDTLLGLLEKIYMALDHYSPVLQHYPGVMEILKLIRREMDEEITNS